jgi:hypothetical protein
MRRIIAVMSLFFATAIVAQAQDSIQHTIVLIGDAGQLTNGRQPVIDGVRKVVAMDTNTTVIFLGDNLYKTGLPDDMLPTYEIAKAPLDSQILIANKTPAKVYFIPGNHDWSNGGKTGYGAILRVQNYIDILGNKNVTQLPRDGCPGPVEVKINGDITVVIVDSQWWLQQNDKPGIESDCPYKTKEEVLTQLNEIFSSNDDKLVLFAMHHPMRSYGQHGGYFKLKQHVFPFTDVNPKLYIPLPVLGSAYPLTRAVFGTEQDLKHPFYQEMINSFEKVVAGHKNVIFVSGHEHTLQMIQDSTRNYIVSGSGSKTSRVSKSRNTLFASSDNGFATLRVSKNKNVRASFYTVYGDSLKEAFTQNILNFTAAQKPEEKKDTARKPEVVFKDSVLISASDKYKHFSEFKRFFLGNNYRREWNEPIRLKVFNIRKEQGGFKIKSLGGGKQTKSLRIEDVNGKEWVLRTIDKDPEKALPENFRGTIGQSIVSDMISASNPYAPFVVPVLAKAAGVPAAAPKFFFVPDDPAFGKYQKLFANSVVMLEDRDPVIGADTKSTTKIINKMLEDNDHHVDQKAVLRARLLDMLIGDWDRHADQWKWGTTDTGKGKLYYPVPKDRDQAFFNSNGLLVKYLARNQMPFLQGFTKNIKDIKGLNYVARDFDRFFLNGISKKEWKQVADSFALSITDNVIDEAVKEFPPEIQPFDNVDIAEKLKKRRNKIAKKSLKYYAFLAKNVTITGSNEMEYFHLQNDSGNVKLTVFKKDEKTDSSTIMYKRIFKAKETNELVLYGLNGDDKFEIDKDVKSAIKLRIVGGKGKDTFNIKGNIRNTLYDLTTEKNVILNHNRTDNDFSSNPSVLDYSNKGFQYNKFIFPLINIGYNAEDGLLMGLGFSSKTFGFRKEPYSTSQKVSTLASLTRGAIQANYEGIFNHVISNYDIVVNAKTEAPTLNNFFGYGNSSVYDKSKGHYYYRSRFKYITGDLLFRRRYNDIFQLSLGPAYYRYQNEYSNNSKRILANPAIVGSDSASLYSVKQYAGLKAKFDINYVNSEIFPTRGITWFTEFSSLQGMNKNSHNINEIESHMTIYASISDISKISGVLRFGGGRIFNDKYEFFQAKTLGFNSYLRGFRRDRFAGQGMAYGSGEVRFRLIRSKSYVLPGDIGMLGFMDIGRVWLKNENSDKWHNSYGGGFYFIPFNVVMVSASVGISNEDKLINFSIGTKFNLTF